MPKKILIVDDEPDIVKVIASRLKANNYDVEVAFDAREAIQVAHKVKPDLIILDIKMPSGSGISVYENLSIFGDTARVPVIFITAYSNDEVRKKVLDLGAADFMEKPFNPDELTEKVNRILGKSANRGEKQDD